MGESLDITVSIVTILITTLPNRNFFQYLE